MLSYAADSAGFYAWLEILPASDGSTIQTNRSPYLPEGIPTYKVMGFRGIVAVDGFQGVMNEHQVAITETTFGGPAKLQNTFGALHYEDLFTITLQQAKTAREAVEIMVREINEHGYIGLGESISICDPNEAWVMELIGTGSTSADNNRGSIWVAIRVPDGTVTAHANQARIREFPRNDPDNCLFAPNIEYFAIEAGLYDRKAGKPFSFADVYGGFDMVDRRACEKRVWSFLRRAAPSLKLSDDYVQGVEGSQPLPWAIVPDRKLTVEDVMALTRDRYEGTPYSMFEGADAEPRGNPLRQRPLSWEVDGKKYVWERPIATPQTCLNIVTQSRGHLPNEIGGVTWLGWDDAYTTCYFPLYMAMTEMPVCGSTGTVERFSPDSSWWIFNFVANYAYPRYSEIYPDIRKVQQELESELLGQQTAVETKAVKLNESDPESMRVFLNDYSNTHALEVHKRWRQLANDLIVKFNDGYVRSPEGKYPPSKGYPESWLRRVVKERGDQLRVPEDKK